MYKIRMILVVLALVIPGGALAQSAQANAPDHAAWDKLLGTYLSTHEDGVNRFDYGAVTMADQALLGAYLDDLAATPVSLLGRDAQMAYWINFYNALTVKVILDHYPVESIRQIKNGFLSFGPWKIKRVTVEGKELSLDDMEHKILRPQFKDPRVHYAVNCASWGCPNLQDRAFTADNLETLLEEGARTYINHPRGVYVHPRGALILSSIYDWFRGDFGRDDEKVLDHIRHYASPELLATLQGRTKISSYAYDWTLNAPDRKKGDY